MIVKGTDLSGAVFSDCDRYRYQLWRRHTPEARTLLWIMLNPSTADHQQLDPTLRRVAGFSYSWGFQNWEVCNILGLRSTDPKQLGKVLDPAGPDNDAQIQDALDRCAEVVLAWGHWGTWGPWANRTRRLVRNSGKPTWALGFTKGPLPQPRHPLYCRADTKALKVFDSVAVAVKGVDNGRSEIP